MIFGAPILLYLLPLAGLPIVFHLILRQKKRTMVFSTLMFFHQVDPKLNTRRQIREWLLLLMRVLMIALVLLALSRPTWRSAVGTGGKLSLVAIIDNSGSMTAAADQGDPTKLECAQEGARRLLSSLEQGTDAAIVLTVEDRAVDVPKTLTADRDELLKCLDRIAPTEATGDAQRALAQAFELLRSTAARGGVVHVFSDLQQVEWGENAKRFEAKDALVHTYLHRIGTSPQPRVNVAVTAVVLPEQRILLGQPYEIGLSLRNNSDLTADVRVNCVNDRGERSTQNLALQKQQIATVRLATTMNEQGYHWLKAWVEGDGFAADNTAGTGLFCEGMGTVLFAGEPRQFGMLPMALCPSGGGQLTGLVTRFAPSIQWGQEDVPVLVVTTWGGLAAAGSNSTELRKYVEGGGNVLVVPSLLPGSDVSTTQTPAWLGASVRPREAYKSGVRLALLNRDAPFWRQMEQVVGDISAEPIVVYAFCPLELPSGVTPLLGAGTKKIVLAHKVVDKGNVFLSGIAFSPRWSTLPLSGLGVIMAQRMAVAGGSGNGSQIVSLVAGERPQAWPAEGETELLSLSGDALEWKGPASEMPPFPRTGVYLATSGNEKYCISVRSSPKEGEYRFVEGSHVPTLASAPHTVIPFAPNEDYTQYHAGQARAVELYIPTLLLLTLVVLLEGLLGASRIRRAREESRARQFLSGVAARLTLPAVRLLLQGRRT
ncbi:MAG: BatA domain-containing protein [Planctomycetes bacterium]|nr:BatA domain-containing protein [Planctomycetota bacterium]